MYKGCLVLLLLLLTVSFFSSGEVLLPWSSFFPFIYRDVAHTHLPGCRMACRSSVGSGLMSQVSELRVTFGESVPDGRAVLRRISSALNLGNPC